MRSPWEQPSAFSRLLYTILIPVPWAHLLVYRLTLSYTWLNSQAVRIPGQSAKCAGAGQAQKGIILGSQEAAMAEKRETDFQQVIRAMFESASNRELAEMLEILLRVILERLDPGARGPRTR